MGIIDGIVKFFIEGGFWMYPILVAGSVGLAIGIERYIKLSREERANRKIWDQLHPVMVAGDFDAARALVASDKSSVSRLLEAGLERQGTVRRRDDIEIAMEEGMMEIIPQLEKRINYIALYANLSTLLGLLGTIVGLIVAFGAVAHASPAEKSELLSASISVAMNTTAFGLIAAIPLLIIHSYLNSKAGAIVDSLEMASVKTLNIISASARKGDQA
jgi:biopolymer transport protein ExbB